jgi:hypothetical protein
MISEPTLSCVAGLGLEPVDEIDHIVETAAGAGANAASRNGNGQVGLASASPTDQRRVALLGDEAATGEIIGKGNADKAAVIAAIRARGFSPVDDNEADALAILLWAIETQGGVQ